MKSSERAIAAQALAKVMGGASLSFVLAWAKKRISIKQQPIVYQLCYDTVRHYYSLSAIRSRLLAKPLPVKHQDINALILIGLYQLIYSNIPSHAAIFETVKATNILRKSWAKNLVNAVLRSAQRQEETLFNIIKQNAVYSFDHPQWLLDLFKKSWPENWEQLCRVNNQQAPMTLRVNQRTVSRDDYLQHLREQGISADKTVLSPDGVTLGDPCLVEHLFGFEKGWVSVQDEAAQLGALLLNCQPKQRVLDACAAPGGKTCHILERGPSLTVWALDHDEARLRQIHMNLNRLKLHAHVVCGDVNTPDQWWDGQYFDRILLDVPCSATGVIRRHPDIKLLKRAEDIEILAQQQHNMLQNVWPLLRPGGMLVYSTCSIAPMENQEQIARFLDVCCDVVLQPIPIPPYAQNVAANIITTSYGMQLLPNSNGHDGFFYSVLKKVLR